jgi:hypothetical protein
MKSPAIKAMWNPLRNLEAKARRALKGSQEEQMLDRKKAETARLLASGRINIQQARAMNYGLRVSHRLLVVRALYHIMRGEALPPLLMRPTAPRRTQRPA